ncbi:MAG: MFS transporter [Propioniciclava sp.]|uniref:MFS transporter n=1 Tax=Propioniciclava sp. TaxID=2038686 RepID=UPI0039E68C62
MTDTLVPDAGRRGRLLLTQAAALVWGLQFAFLNPALAFFLTDVLGANAGEVGLILALFNASGFVASLIVPAIADRRRDYLGPILTSGFLSLALAASLGLVGSLPWAAVALVVLGGPAGVGSSLLFAHLNAAGDSHGEVMSSRAMVSAAWVVGPPLAMMLAGAAGIRSVLVAIAAASVLGIGFIVALRRRSSSVVAPAARPSDEGGPLPMGRLVLVVVTFVALQATNATSTSMMTLFTVHGLGLDPVWGGVALAVAAGIEIPALLLLGRLSARHRPLRLLIVGVIAGGLYYLGIAMVTGVVGLIAVQLLNAWFVATVQGVGMVWFMDIIPRPGIASGLFSNTFRIGAVLSGALIAVSGTAAGYTGMYLLCAALSAFALTVLLVVGRLGRRAVSPGAVSPG